MSSSSGPDAVTDPAVKRLGSSLSIEQTHAGGMIIGGTREFADYEEENTFEAIEVMLKRAARFFPALKNVSVIRFFSGFRPFTPDGMPLLGPVRGGARLLHGRRTRGRRHCAFAHHRQAGGRADRLWRKLI